MGRQTVFQMKYWRQSCPNLFRVGWTACRDGPNLHRHARFPLPGDPQPSVTSFSGEIRGADNASNLGLAL